MWPPFIPPGHHKVKGPGEGPNYDNWDMIRQIGKVAKSCFGFPSTQDVL